MPPYQEGSIREHLQQIGVRSWSLAGKADSSPGEFEEVVDYCWTAYSKSYNSTGDLVIGRVPHLERAGLYEKVAEIFSGQTMRDSGAHGNLLRTDKWATVVNDAWVLGGIHRHAMFRLASPRVIQNLWNEDGFFVVTAREILGLLRFGYRHEQIGPWQCMACVNTDEADSADLVSYHRLINERQSIRAACELIDQEGSTARVQKQVQAARRH